MNFSSFNSSFRIIAISALSLSLLLTRAAIANEGTNEIRREVEINGQKAVIVTTFGMDQDPEAAQNLRKAVIENTRPGTNVHFISAEGDPEARKVADALARVYSGEPVIEAFVPQERDSRLLRALEIAASAFWKLPKSFLEWKKEPRNQRTLWFAYARLIVSGSVVATQVFVASDYRVSLAYAGAIGLVVGTFSGGVHAGGDLFLNYGMRNQKLANLLFGEGTDATPAKAPLAQNAISRILRREATPADLKHWRERYLNTQAHGVWLSTEVIFSSLIAVAMKGVGGAIDSFSIIGLDNIVALSTMAWLAQGRPEVLIYKIYERALRALGADPKHLDSASLAEAGIDRRDVERITFKKDVFVALVSFLSVGSVAASLGGFDIGQYVLGIMTVGGGIANLIDNLAHKQGLTYRAIQAVKRRVRCNNALTGIFTPPAGAEAELKQSLDDAGDAIDQLPETSLKRAS